MHNIYVSTRKKNTENMYIIVSINAIVVKKGFTAVLLHFMFPQLTVSS